MLKRCPICGSKAKLYKYKDKDGVVFYHIFCTSDNVPFLGTDAWYRKKDAIKEWNDMIKHDKMIYKRMFDKEG